MQQYASAKAFIQGLSRMRPEEKEEMSLYEDGEGRIQVQNDEDGEVLFSAEPKDLLSALFTSLGVNGVITRVYKEEKRTIPDFTNVRITPQLVTVISHTPDLDDSVSTYSTDQLPPWLRPARPILEYFVFRGMTVQYGETTHTIQIWEEEERE